MRAKPDTGEGTAGATATAGAPLLRQVTSTMAAIRNDMAASPGGLAAIFRRTG